MKNIHEEIGTLQLHRYRLFKEASDIRYLFDMRTCINMYSVWINSNKYNLSERISDWDYHSVMHSIKGTAISGLK